jgi:putative endonuclease
MAFKLSNKLGLWGEQRAEDEYLKRGYVLVARNICNNRGKRMGEIDLIMRTDTELVFVEVKTRRGNKYGSAAESITLAKKKKIIRIVDWFRRLFPQYSTLNPRIDVCAIDVGFAQNLDNGPGNVIIIPYAVTLDD